MPGWKERSKITTPKSSSALRTWVLSRLTDVTRPRGFDEASVALHRDEVAQLLQCGGR
jgi:hypothetical protein